MSQLLRSQLLESAGGIVMGVSTRQVGNLSYLYGEAGAVTAARREFWRMLATVGDRLVVYRALNRDVIVEVDETYRGIGTGPTLPLRADAVISRVRGLGVMLLLADCLGVVVYDPRQELIALAHCGLRSTNDRLAQKLVQCLAAQYGSRLEDLLVYLTPAIGPDHYVYDSRVKQFTDGWGRHMQQTGPDEYHPDLLGYNLEQLAQAGVEPSRIEAANIDTYSSPLMYSHVRALGQGEEKKLFGVYVELAR